MLRAMWRFIVILGLAFCPFAVSAEDGAAERRELSVDEQPKWSGVGRLNHSRGGFCSGALIAPDLVLTAAHCVVDERTNEPIPPSDLKFVAGLRSGIYTANRRAVAAKVHPKWGGYLGQGKVTVEGDLAVVKLETPITGFEAKSFEIGAAPDVGADVVLLSYGRGRESALSIQEPCQVLERYNRSAALNCDSAKGTSGAPIFADGRIVGVISAQDRGEAPRRSYAALLEGTLDDIYIVSEEPKEDRRRRYKAVTIIKQPEGRSRLPFGKRPPLN